MPSSIFAQEWRDCLRAHYTTVVRASDHVTEKTLRTVMFEAGFSEDDLRQLYIQATAHVDNVGDDFVPDMDFIEGKAEAVIVPAVSVTPEVIEAEIVEESVAMDEAADAESESDEADQSEQADEAQDEAPKNDPDVTQLSLF